MAQKKAIKKKSFSLSSLKKSHSSKTKYKPTQFFDIGEAFHKASGLPGPVMHNINMFLGHSNSSKTTALIGSAVSAIKQGYLPVFCITERKWSWDYCEKLGLDSEFITDEDGNEVVDGMFLFNDDFQTIEQVTDYVNELLDIQEKDGMPEGPDGEPFKGYLFLWDSVGSIPCQMTFEGKGGSMHNARVLADKIGMGLTSRITNSKRDDYPYDNTMVIVNQPWVELPDNPFGQPKIKAKGGEAIWLNSALVFLFGNQKNSGISQLDATKDGRKVAFATKTKISILKNHVNGLGYKDGKIIATPHGYIEDTPNSIKQYKEDYADYWKDIMGGDFNLKEGPKSKDEDMDGIEGLV
jgi:hypothetical protein